MSRLAEAARNDNDDLIVAVMRVLARAIGAEDGTMTFAAREQSALAISNEAVRRYLESELQRAADGEADMVAVDARSFRRHELGTVTYHSLCGPLRIRRSTYRATGQRNGPTIVPLELATGMIERATPALAYAVAQGYAKSPSRDFEKDLLAARRAPPSRSTLERMAKRIATSAKGEIETIEPEVRAVEDIPEKTTGVTIGLDRTTVPMAEDPTDEEREGGKKIAVHYRMAYVGTIALTDRDGEVLCSRRYAVGAHEDPHLITARLMSDLVHVLKHKPHVEVGIVQDGAPELWRLIDEALEKWKPPAARIHRVIDMFHLCERLSTALQITYPKQNQAPLRAKMLAKWKRSLLRKDEAIKDISDFFEVGPRYDRRCARRTNLHAASMGFFKTRDHYYVDRSDLPRPPPPKPLPPSKFDERARTEIDRLLGGYLLVPHMFRYAPLAKLGLHVGSGVTEGACKSLIAARTKRSGQRWRKPGIEAVLTVRSLLQSNRFDEFWHRFAQQHAPLAIAA